MSHKNRVCTAQKVSKPCTIEQESEASLLDWLRCYPVMRQPKQAKMFLGLSEWSQAELAEVYHAGLPHVAIELGYRPALEAHTGVQSYNFDISDSKTAENLPCA